MRLARDTLGPAYAFCDPHGGKRDVSMKRLSSRAAICVGAADAIGRIFVLHAWAARCSTDELIDRIYAINTQYTPKTFGIEANGLAALFGDAIIRDARLAGKRLPLVEVFQPSHQEKDFRIRTILQPHVGNGRLFLDENDPGQKELLHEVLTFPTNPLKDMIDACASMVRMIPPPQPRLVRDTERDAKLAYLRASGAHPTYIQEVARGRVA